MQQGVLEMNALGKRLAQGVAQRWSAQYPSPQEAEGEQGGADWKSPEQAINARG